MTVTFFGHRDTPKETEQILRSVVIDLIKNQNATLFYVGSNGNFDIMVRRQLEDLSKLYPINYCVVLAYIPITKSEYEDLSNSITPEGIENVPRRFAISHRNKWMIKQSDIVVTYVTRNFGGAWQFKSISEKQGKNVIELAK